MSSWRFLETIIFPSNLVICKFQPLVFRGFCFFPIFWFTSRDSAKRCRRFKGCCDMLYRTPVRTKVSRLGSPVSAVAGFRVFRPPKKLGKNGTPIFAPTKISLKKYVDETFWLDGVFSLQALDIPVVPHKAVAEASRRGKL